MKGQLERRWILILVIIVALLLLFFYPRGNDPKDNSSSSEASGNHSNSQMTVVSEQPTNIHNSDGASTKTPAVAPIPVNGLNPQVVEKARSLGKTTLSSLYTAQRAYMAEFSRPTSDLLSLGFTPDDSVMHFKAGFLEALEPEEFNDITNDGRPAFREDPRRINTDVFLEEKQDEKATRYEYSTAAAAINLDDYKRFCRIGCKVQGQEFEFMVVVPLDDTHFDIWTMNHLKQLNLVKDGTRKD